MNKQPRVFTPEQELVILHAYNKGWRVENRNENPIFPCFVLLTPSGGYADSAQWDSGLTYVEAWLSLPMLIEGV